MNKIKISQLIGCVLLLIAIAKLPYWYYEILRFAISIIAGLNIFAVITNADHDLLVYNKHFDWPEESMNPHRWNWSMKNKVLFFLYLTILVLFNPIFPVYCSKSVWTIIDLTVGVSFGALVFVSTKPDREKKLDRLAKQDLRDNKELRKTTDDFINWLFPKGNQDIKAGVDELLYILKNCISREEAKSILVRSLIMSQMEKFDIGVLKSHLSGYCIEHFNERQIEIFYYYLLALKSARVFYKKTPSEVRREGYTYKW